MAAAKGIGGLQAWVQSTLGVDDPFKAQQIAIKIQKKNAASPSGGLPIGTIKRGADGTVRKKVAPGQWKVVPQKKRKQGAPGPGAPGAPPPGAKKKRKDVPRGEKEKAPRGEKEKRVKFRETSIGRDLDALKGLGVLGPKPSAAVKWAKPKGKKRGATPSGEDHGSREERGEKRVKFRETSIGRDLDALKGLGVLGPRPGSVVKWAKAPKEKPIKAPKEKPEKVPKEKAPKPVREKKVKASKEKKAKTPKTKREKSEKKAKAPRQQRGPQRGFFSDVLDQMIKGVRAGAGRR